MSCKNRNLFNKQRKYLSSTFLSPGESLYELSAHAVIENFTVLRHGLEDVPETILFDVVHQMYQRKQMDKLTEELSNFTTFTKLLKVRDKRATLHKLLQATVERRARVPEILAQV